MKDICKAEIHGYGYDGEGVARIGGKVVFLPFALKGENVEFVVTEEKNSFLRGKVEKVLSANSKRIKPKCPYFMKCGGCTLQHADYDYELEIKQELLANQLKKVGFLGQIDLCASPKDYGYRNKIRLFVGENGLALKERGSCNFVYIKRCLLVQERINDAIEKINNFIVLQSLSKSIGEVVIRQEGQSLLINFVLKRDADINYQGIFLLLGDCGIYETKKGVCKHKIGLKSLKTNEMGIDCEFSVNSFHQVNSLLMEKLYKSVVENIHGDHVINCYSGAGVLGGIIAKQGKIVTGIELGDSEHKDAEMLKNVNNLNNLTNICGDCGEVMSNWQTFADTIIVDPPRAGMSIEVCKALNKIDCKRLVYVSCNSATLVRDLARLDKFDIKKVLLFDMFARTGEYEVLCVCDKK